MLTKLMQTITEKIFVKPTPEEIRRKEILAEWDRQLDNAINERDRAEIDAIFSRAL
jgi:hypothetical protein